MTLKYATTLLVALSISTAAFAGDNPWAETARQPATADSAELQIKNVEAVGVTSRECAEEARFLTNSSFNETELTAMLERGPERDEGEAGIAKHELVAKAIHGVTSYLIILELNAGKAVIGQRIQTVGCSINTGAMTFYEGAREGNAAQMVEGGHRFAVITVSLAHAARGFAALQSTPQSIANNARVTGFVSDAFGSLAAKTQPQLALAAAVPLTSAAGLSSQARLGIDRLLFEGLENGGLLQDGRVGSGMAVGPTETGATYRVRPDGTRIQRMPPVTGRFPSGHTVYLLAASRPATGVWRRAFYTVLGGAAGGTAVWGLTEVFSDD